MSKTTTPNDLFQGDNYSEETFKMLSEQSSDAILVAKGNRLLYVNKKCEALTGYTRRELCDPAFSIERILPPQPAAAAAPRRNGKRPVTVESIIVNKNGKKIPASMTSHNIKINGEEANMKMLTDISHQKEIERMLRDSEDNYRLTIDLLADYVHIVDANLHVLFFNDAFRQLNEKLGMRNTSIGKNLMKVYTFLPQRVIAEYDKVFRTGELLVTHERQRIRGGVYYTETRKIPVFENGEVVRVITVVKDITKDKNTEKELVALNRELMKTNRRLRQLIFTDSHTGLYNHRFFNSMLEEEFTRAKDENKPLSMILLDLDYFKSINDVYGHRVGDMVLKQFAQILKKKVPRTCNVIRYGGEEFIILAPGLLRESSVKIAQSIQDTVAITQFGGKNDNIKLKLTIAIASHPEDGAIQPMGLLEIADQILNKAKEYGGNRVFSMDDVKKAHKKEGQSGGGSNIKYLQEKMERMNKRANQGLIESIFAFAKTIELKDHYTGEHVERTVYFATRIAEALGLPKEEILHIKQAAVLHDLGKVGISERILLKPAKLTLQEFKEIKKHPLIGVDIIRPIHLLHHIVPLIMYHHERWDGKGYPVGLKGEEIPIGARVIALADTYQALISNRPYRKAFPKAEARAIIKRMSGSQFDPTVVAAFLTIF